MDQSGYAHLEDYGRQIFRSVFDNSKEEKNLQVQRLINELLQLFRQQILFTVERRGSLPDINDFITQVRTVTLQGIFSEATELSKSYIAIMKMAPRDFPIRKAVNISREAIYSILDAFYEKGAAASPACLQMLQERSAKEIQWFKDQVEIALKKQEESEMARKKLSQTLSDATKKFQSHLHHLSEEQTRLENEKAWFLLQAAQLQEEVEKATKETTRTIGRNRELEKTLEEKESALTLANNTIKTIEVELERWKKARGTLAKIDAKLQKIAKDSTTGPERLISILEELEKLRQQEIVFRQRETINNQLSKRTLELGIINDTLIRQLEEQKRLTKQASIASLLDGSYNTDENVTGWYYYALEEYFAISLREYGKTLKDDLSLQRSEQKLRELFFLTQSRWLDAIDLGEKRLQEIKTVWKSRDNLGEYDLSPFIIEWMYRELTKLLQSLIQTKPWITAYANMAGMMG